MAAGPQSATGTGGYATVNDGTSCAIDERGGDDDDDTAAAAVLL
jgi:hypothetical protein